MGRGKPKTVNPEKKTKFTNIFSFLRKNVYPNLSEERARIAIKKDISWAESDGPFGITLSGVKLDGLINKLIKHYDLPDAAFESQAGPGESALSQPEPVEGNNLESTENDAGKQAFNNTPTEGPPFQPPNPTTFSVNTNGQFIKNEPIENKIAETLNDIDNIQKQTKAGQKVVKAETAQEVANLKAVAATIPVTELPSATKANEKDYKEGLIFRDPIQEAQDRYNDYIRQIKKTSMYY